MSFFSCRRQKMMEKEDFTKSKTSSSLLSDESSDLAGVRYRPKTRETKSTYEVLLSFIQAAIGDQVTMKMCALLKHCISEDFCCYFFRRHYCEQNISLYCMYNL